MKRVYPILLLLILMSACAPDPRREAQAFAIKTTAEQEALNGEQNREHAEDLHVIQLEQLQLEEQHREATAREWRAGLNKMIHYGFIFGTIGLCATLLALAFSFSYGSVGVSLATTRAANVRANLIMLDRVTRQFPLFMHHVHGTRYALINPNTGSVSMLDENHEADRQMIAAAGATQIAGVIAQEARQSNDPAGVAIINPPVIDANSNGLQIGQRVFERMIPLPSEDRNE